MALEDRLVSNLYKRGLTISTAESCTGGLIAGRIINAPGASAVYNEGFITYSNAAKEKYLGVGHDTLEEYGAVSAETAFEMALGCCERTGSDMAVISTGIAGPDGGTPEKPVGLVYIAVCSGSQVVVEECHFSGSRSEIREASVEAALNLVSKVMAEVR
ncbi:MAG: CinA family protein [Lachnospiraceae bacterium]|nr:CinA family protein [Candidatus Equihabitans merdae]